MTQPRASAAVVQTREEQLQALLKELQKIKPSLLPEERYKKFRKMGVFEKG